MAGFTNNILNAVNVNFSGANPTVGQVTQDGELLIGAANSPHLRVNKLIAGTGMTIINGPGTIELQSSGGIDYSTGTWVPDLLFGGAGVGITYAVQKGFYTRLGNVVNVAGYIELTNKGSSTGLATIAGLPFAFGSNGDTFPLATVNGNFFYGAYTDIVVQGVSSSSSLQVLACVTNLPPVQLQDANFSNSTILIFSGSYIMSV